ncbi:MAG: hypothetical protein K8R79_04785, partial [Calditrichales bacterium]|nr:hypothetical protein [Calditrichales bacterium]
MLELVTYLFEKLANDTWDRLKYSFQLGISQNEETITDINLLEICKRNFNEIKILKLTKDEESKKGIDWEWWIGSNRYGWLRFAVQAKKISDDSRSYKSINHKVNGRLQINILEEYSQLTKAIPMYCFYNYVDFKNLEKYWHCKYEFDKKQLGCTISPLSIVKQASKQRGKKTFEFIHSHRLSLPWRCITKCPIYSSKYINSLKEYIEPVIGEVYIYKSIPK